ncbi:hypothetical protein [Vibrio sp. HA2012]|uniref:hypothetical protein n=1 Tax=Vibrio sp. HA2012 TaxID=1971595 RepID=UPI0012FD1ED7|nr:hypothetical protein [Vibrio sp. HA2012]
MSATLISQVKTTEIDNKTKSALFDTAYQFASVLTMFAVTATVVTLISFQWIA